MNTTVAIPRFGDLVAPRFELARSIVIARIDAQGCNHRSILPVAHRVGFERIELLFEAQIDVVICSGIKRIYRDLLQLHGVAVMADVTGSIDSIISRCVTDGLEPLAPPPPALETPPVMPLESMINWTRDLFAASGYEVYPAGEHAPFPVDLVAEIRCPVCRKRIRVAICCGAHAYRPDQEITRLHQVAGPTYQARVYIHASSDQIRKCCGEYGIELLDPDQVERKRGLPRSKYLPILQNAIPGHERAWARAPER